MINTKIFICTCVSRRDVPRTKESDMIFTMCSSKWFMKGGFSSPTHRTNNPQLL